MVPRTPTSTRTDTLFPYTTLFLFRPARRRGRRQLVDDIVGAAAHFGIAGLLPGQHQRGHIMAQRMPRDRVAFPAAINRRLRLHPRIGSEIVEQAIGFEAVEVGAVRSDEHTSELQSLMRCSYAVFCLKKNKTHVTQINNTSNI